MSENQTKVVVITGASSGIGYATALRLARAGYPVMLGARRVDRLTKLAADIGSAGGIAHFEALDVTKRPSVASFVASALTRFGRVDVLINNAGIMPLSRLEALKVDEWDNMIDVNIRGVLYGIAEVLPIMQRQNGGHIINLSSIGGYRVGPAGSVYSATKFAVRAISDGLRQETTTIRVTVVSPGVTESDLASTITDPFAKERMETFREVAMPPDAIASAIQYAIEQPIDVDVSEMIVRPTASAH
jgi:NADP-dependent 3-hydroxy acid dehydrogenase YdfG